jgi:hypothetical protein
MLLGVQREGLGCGLLLLAGVEPIERLIRCSRELSGVLSPDPFVIGTGVGPERILDKLESLCREMRPELYAGTWEVPLWCTTVANEAAAGDVRAEVSALSMDSTDFAEPFDRLRRKFAEALQNHMGTLRCDEKELAVLCLLAGESQHPAMAGSSVILPEYMRVCRAYAKRDSECARYSNLLEHPDLLT